MMKRWVLIGLLLLFFGRLLHAEAQKSSTFDEVYYLLQATVYWQRQPLIPITQHPPMSNAIMGLPINLLTDPTIPTDHPEWNSIRKAQIFLWDANQAQSAQIEWAGRYAIISLALLTAALLFRWTRQLTGSSTIALIAVLLLTNDPNLLAHSFLATTDIPLTFFFLLTAYRYWCYWKKPTRRNFLYAGLALGAVCTVKLTAIVMIVAVVVMTFYRLVASRNWQARAWLAGGVQIVGWLAIAAIVYVSVYQFNWEVLVHDWTQQRLHMQDGHSGFLLGENKIGGWWYYFPLVFAIKTPIPILILVILTAGLILRRLAFDWETVWPLLIGGGLFAASLLSTINLGYRYLLPLLPLLYLSIAQNSVMLPMRTLSPSPSGFWKRLQIGVVAICLFGAVLISWQTHPDYLAYFNRLGGGSDNGWRIVVDSNIDWGQDVQALADYIATEQPEKLSATWLGNKPLDKFGVSADILPGWPLSRDNVPFSDYYAPQPPPGEYAISVTQLQGTYLADKERFAYFRELTPVQKFGYSIFLFQVDQIGEAVDVALSGIDIVDIQPDDYARWETNEVRWRWFDARNALVLPAGERSGLLVGSGHLPTHPALAPFYQTPVWQGENGDGTRSFAFYNASAIDHSVFATDWWFTTEPVVASGEWEEQAQISAETAPTFGSSIALTGYQYLPTENGGDVITSWQLLQPLDQPLRSFIHLIDANGTIVAQTDSWHVESPGLQAGDQIVQVHSVPTTDLADGEFGVQIGLYNRDTFERLPMTVDGYGSSDRVLLKRFSLTR